MNDVRSHIETVHDKVSRRRPATPRRSVFWWNDEIAVLKRTCIAALRDYQWAGRRGFPRADMHEAFKRARKSLRITIRTAQEKAWKDLVNTVKADPWGRAY